MQRSARTRLARVGVVAVGDDGEIVAVRWTDAQAQIPFRHLRERSCHAPRLLTEIADVERELQPHAAARTVGDASAASDRTSVRARSARGDPVSPRLSDARSSCAARRDGCREQQHARSTPSRVGTGFP